MKKSLRAIIIPEESISRDDVMIKTCEFEYNNSMDGGTNMLRAFIDYIITDAAKDINQAFYQFDIKTVVDYIYEVVANDLGSNVYTFTMDVPDLSVPSMIVYVKMNPTRSPEIDMKILDTAYHVFVTML